jgi:hypothetical protein
MPSTDQQIVELLRAILEQLKGIAAILQEPKGH